MYTPHVGRWLSEDPAGYVDGPNQYLYVKNNPINMTDPSGLEGIEAWNPLTFTY
jgi:RHS repeat-associated protein